MKFEGMTEKNKEKFLEYINKINSELERYFAGISEKAGEQSAVTEAMRYSLSAGGKRIRPVLVMEFCRVCGGAPEKALSAACAVEMIHTFSLIHDDLPCMDNDDLRRGKPSCHKAFGEATALLAGDALENEAFLIIAEDKLLEAEKKAALIRELSAATGISGMIGGQTIDTVYNGKALSEEQLLKMYSMKTGALLKASCRMGCICAGAGKEKLRAAEEFALKLGLAFQIIDDILDIVGSKEELGKTIGSDAENGKLTYAVLNGLERSEAFAAELTDEALLALDAFDDNEFLRGLTLYLLDRKS